MTSVSSSRPKLETRKVDIEFAVLEWLLRGEEAGRLEITYPLPADFRIVDAYPTRWVRGDGKLRLEITAPELPPRSPGGNAYDADLPSPLFTWYSRVPESDLISLYLESLSFPMVVDQAHNSIPYQPTKWYGYDCGSVFSLPGNHDRGINGSKINPPLPGETVADFRFRCP